MIFMNRTEHLLTILSEECSEVAQRVSKALRFTVKEIQPGQELTNWDRIQQEFNDLCAVARMLGFDYPKGNEGRLKVAKVEKFLAYSRDCGTLHP